MQLVRLDIARLRAGIMSGASMVEQF